MGKSNTVGIPRLNLFEWGMALHLVYTMIPAASVYLGGKVNMLFVALAYLGIISYCGLNIFVRLLPYMMLYLLPMIYQILNSSFSLGAIASIGISTGIDMLISLLPVAICYYLVICEKYVEYEFILKMVLLAMVITAVTSSFSLGSNPYAARILATDIDATSEVYLTIKRLNIGGYYFVYSAVLIIPLIVSLWKENRISTIFFVFTIISFAMISYQSSYATAVLLFGYSIVLLFFMKNPTKRKIIIFSLVFFVFVVFFSGVISDFLVRISDSLPTGYIKDRLYSLGMSFGGEIGLDADGYDSVGSRKLLYLKSLAEFITHPLVGNSLFQQGRIGGHSMILDYLAMYGAVGGAVLIGLYKRIYRDFYLPYRDYYCFGYMFLTLILSIMLDFINTGYFFLSIIFIPAGVAMSNRDVIYSLTEHD